MGHTEFVSDANGDAYQYFWYSPFGDAIVEEHANTASFSSRYLFNAKELDPETGRYYYGARYYDPGLSIWLSVDPLYVAIPHLSPYVFCNGNTINLVDRDGRNAGWWVNQETGEVMHIPGDGTPDEVLVEGADNYELFASDQEMDINSNFQAPSSDAGYTSSSWSAEEANENFTRWGMSTTYSVMMESYVEFSTMVTKDWEMFGPPITLESMQNAEVVSSEYTVSGYQKMNHYNWENIPELLSIDRPTARMYPKSYNYGERIMHDIYSSPLNQANTGVGLSGKQSNVLIPTIIQESIKLYFMMR